MEFPTSNGGPLHGGDDTMRAYVDQQIASLRKEVLMLLNHKGEAPPELKAAEATTADGGEAVTAVHLDEDDGHGLEESVWDCTIFVGLDCLGAAESCTVVFLWLLNVFVQIYFFFIICSGDMLSDPLAPSMLDGLLRFRTGVAHRVENADLISRRSLLSQVCDGDERLHVSGTQTSLLFGLRSFAEQGRLLGLLALLCWSARVLGEAGSTIRFARAVLQRRGSCTQVLLNAQGGFVMKSLSTLDVIKAFCLAILPRLAVVVGLYVIGLIYLCRTSTLEDMLLNAMTLGFVLDVDELLFTAFMPHRAKSLVRGVGPLPVAPLRCPKATRCHSFGPWPGVLRFLAAAIIILIMDQTYLVPFHRRLQQAVDILCDGEKDFVFSLNPANGMVESARSSPAGADDWLPAECAVLHMAHPRLVETPWPELCRPELRQFLPDEFSKAQFDHVNSLAYADVQQAGVGATCGDKIRPGTSAAFLAALRNAVDKEVNNCTEVKALCSWKNMTTVRALCPETCGCHFLGLSAAGFFKTADQGCPTSCLAQAKAVEATYADYGMFPQACKDTPALEQRTTSQTWAHIDLGEDGMLAPFEVDAAYLQHLIDVEFRADLYMFASLDSNFSVYWTEESFKVVADVRDLFEDLDLDRDGNISVADAVGVLVDASSDLDGNGLITKAEVAGYNGYESVPSLAPPRISLDWRSSMHIYLRGLFEYLHSLPNFFETLEQALLSAGPAYNLTLQQQGQVMDHLRKGAEEDWSNDVWTVAPGLKHFRGLERCQFLSSYEMQLLLQTNLCKPQGLSSLRSVCPESCKCEAEMEECPASCPSSTALAKALSSAALPG